ncbi:MAG: trehalase family glycosidase [Candidatus Methylomirabilales bacterium]
MNPMPAKTGTLPVTLPFPGGGGTELLEGNPRATLQGVRFAADLDDEWQFAGGAGDLLPIVETPVERVSRSIRDMYWDGLTRRIDKEHLGELLHDEKIPTNGVRYVYVPHTDPRAYAYFSQVAAERPDLQLRVERLPAKITPEYVRGLEGRHGLLSLGLECTPEGEEAGVPFVVPGGRFNEMYGWDSYFEALGLLADGRVDLAKAMVDNGVYQIRHYGKVLNANRTYYLSRSNPPFLTSMALAVYEHLPKATETKAWLRNVMMAAMKEYHDVWMNQDRLTATGLSRYHGSGLGPPPEVEPGHFDAIYEPYAVERNMGVREFEQLYKAGEITVPALDTFFVHDSSVRESGHDTTYRWDSDGDRCADFVTVDLNTLLYKMELDIGRTINQEFEGTFPQADGPDGTSATWYARAQKRKERIHRYLWDEQHGMFFDYDLVKQQRHVYVSATTFYPLWASYTDDPTTQLVTPEQAKRLVASALPLLEMAGGIAASRDASRGPLSEARPARQWDYPIGWAPHQMVIWRGLLNYGFDAIAHRLMYRWLYTITRNAVDQNGALSEKLDVVERSDEVVAEYGNVGTQSASIPTQGFGWMNASYQVGLKLLPPGLRACLERLVPPEWLWGVPSFLWRVPQGLILPVSSAAGNFAQAHPCVPSIGAMDLVVSKRDLGHRRLGYGRGARACARESGPTRSLALTGGIPMAVQETHSRRPFRLSHGWSGKRTLSSQPLALSGYY